MAIKQKQIFKINAKEHLEKVILPYWNNMKDDTYGGFYGFKTFDLDLLKEADKGVILHSRILWFYSNAYLEAGNKESLEYAKHAYEFIKKHCFDYVHGGVYWMLKYDGSVVDSTKNAYNQAFCIYGLASYYRASGNNEALSLAYSLFQCIETYCADEYGYKEAFSIDWKSPVESAICDQGVVADKTMNTLLHVLEAYTELLLADNHPVVAKALTKCLEIVATKVYNPKYVRLETFFDTKMNSLADIHSYGHDIEATWLLDRAADILENFIQGYAKKIEACNETLNNELKARVLSVIKTTRIYTPEIAKRVLESAFDGQALNNESRGEIAQKEGSGNENIDTERIWWVQAESVVGFINAYQVTQNPDFLTAANLIGNYIEKSLVDPRQNSEWFWSVSKNGIPSRHGITEPWKCPYHNGRMCLELISRGFE